MLENELTQNMKQASVQILGSENFKRNLIDDKQSNIYEVFFIPSSFSFPIVMGLFWPKIR